MQPKKNPEKCTFSSILPLQSLRFRIIIIIRDILLIFLRGDLSMQNEKLRNVAIIAHVDLVGASCTSPISA